jgi:wyosine [tRNA(Phe)-imidazoG37] synthetase (radical SAM superfamily)
MTGERAERTRFTYGPVPSRRLGMSLGVDIVPPKICTLDCIYCQLGRTPQTTTTRGDFVDVPAVLDELADRLRSGTQADYITIGGSGEPTLNLRLGDLIDGIRRLTTIPVALLTNGTLLYRPEVRADCAKADVVAPSLDAGDATAFEAVNRPARDITIASLVSGLEQFRREFGGQIWLEVFLIGGVNTDAQQIGKIKALIARIQPDRVHLNTAVRPPAEPGVEPLSRERLDAIAAEIGGRCEVIGEAPGGPGERHDVHAEADLVSMLKRRPCTADDIAAGLGMSRNEVAKHLSRLQRQRVATSERRGGTLYFHIRPATP